MSYGLYVSAEGAHSQEFRLRTIANNIANIETPGFKRELALQMARHTERIDQGFDFPGSGSINDISGGVITVGTATQFILGKVESTQEKTDVAIDGDGFFVVQDTRTGEHLLTRAGNFQVMPDGRLMLHSGETHFSVCDRDLEPITIADPSDPTWSIEQDGAILEGGERTSTIALAIPNNYKNMLKLGENVYRSLDGQELVAEGETRMKAFCLEKSAVNPAAEMIEMIVAARAIETNTKMMQTQDELTAGLISRVLRIT